MDHIEHSARRGRPSTRNREHVLETALRAYWQDDRATTSVNAICTLAGVSKPSLYRDFGSEDGLTTAVLERYHDWVLAPIGALLTSPIRYTDKLQALIDFASEDPQMATGCLFVKMRATRSRFGEQTQTMITSIEAQLLRQYTQFFQAAEQTGEWASPMSAELAAGYLNEQLSLAATQRAAGKATGLIRSWLSLALSVLR